ncbi:hypothetical protein WJX73_000553 [Symbiochloris irregularis]|uniref:SRPBCC family protein n=1 Tax=Symbiochloris irregularis TaxID=706552 RepID=A0AAW1NP60_9CHLO
MNMEDYAHTVVRTSAIVPASLEDVWEVIRIFGNVADWVAPVGHFTTMNSELMPGHLEGQIGCKRIVTFNGKSYVQELTALDDDKHLQRYKTVSYPGAMNPFPYSLMDYTSCLQLRDVTLSDHTFIDWESEFATDPQGTETMQKLVRSQMESGIACLCDYFTRGRVPATPPIGATVGGRLVGAAAHRHMCTAEGTKGCLLI